MVMHGVALAVSASCTRLVALLTARNPIVQELHAARDRPLVEVSAIVSREGQPVTDLQASDVEVLDNGLPQPIVAFEHVNTITGDTPERAGDFVLVIDDMGTAREGTGAAITVGLTLVMR